MQRVIKHSEGMISVEVSNLPPSRESVGFVKRTEIYAELVKLTGVVHAEHSVAGIFPDQKCEFCKSLHKNNN